MRSKVIFGHPKWPPVAILWKKSKKIQVAYWSEMWSKVIFGHPKWPPAAILCEKKVAYWSEMARNAIKSDFQSSKMVIQKKIKNKKLRIDLKWREMRSKVIFGHPFCEKNQSCVLIWNGEKCDRKWFQNGGGGASQWPACKPFGYIHSICPWANTPILVILWNHALYEIDYNIKNVETLIHNVHYIGCTLTFFSLFGKSIVPVTCPGYM